MTTTYGLPASMLVTALVRAIMRSAVVEPVWTGRKANWLEKEIFEVEKGEQDKKIATSKCIP